MRRRGRGAALVEFSVVLLLLVLLGFGIYEFGSAWRSSASALSAVRTGARIASSLGVDPQADYQALTSLKAELQADGVLDAVQLVVIYKVESVDGSLPAACAANTSSSAHCNVYTANNLATLDLSQFDTTTGCLTAATVKNYCPSARNPIMASADYVGVWVKLRHGYQTRLFGSGIDIKRSAVMRIEPRVG